VGTAILGIVLFGESASAGRLAASRSSLLASSGSSWRRRADSRGEHASLGQHYSCVWNAASSTIVLQQHSTTGERIGKRPLRHSPCVPPRDGFGGLCYLYAIRSVRGTTLPRRRRGQSAGFGAQRVRFRRDGLFAVRHPPALRDGFRVYTQSGEVFGERKLLHDHRDEQPFTRDLDSVKIRKP